MLLLCGSGASWLVSTAPSRPTCASGVTWHERAHQIVMLDPQARSQQHEQKWKLNSHLRQLESYGTEATDEACAACLERLDAIRADGFAANVNAHNKAIGLCAHKLDAAERLFKELVECGIENEGSYAGLIRAQVICGRRDEASATLCQLLDGQPRRRPKLRTFSPLLLSACEAGDAGTATQLWRQLRLRRVVFSPVEYGAMLRMHGRAGSRQQLSSLLDELLTEHPTPSESTLEDVRAAVLACAEATQDGETGAERSAVEAGGELCGARLRLLRLSDEQCKEVRAMKPPCVTAMCNRHITDEQCEEVRAVLIEDAMKPPCVTAMCNRHVTAM